MSPKKKVGKHVSQTISEPEERRREGLPFAATWLNPEDMMLRNKPNNEGPAPPVTTSGTPTVRLVGAEGVVEGHVESGP